MNFLSGRIFAALILILALMAGGGAWACTNPGGVAGDIIYNPQARGIQHCDGYNWWAWAKLSQAGEDYRPATVLFDGTNDYIRQSGMPAGIADSGRVTFSAWIKRNATGAQHNLFVIGARFTVRISAVGNLEVVGLNSANTQILNRTTTGAPLDNTNWNHVLFSLDMSDSATMRVYINDTQAALSAGTYNAGNIDFTVSNYAVAAAYNGANALNGQMAELWMEAGRYVDLTVESNRRKFRSASGTPQYLGVDGSLPFGRQPHFFLTGDATGWHINKGRAGGFGNVFPASPGVLRAGTPIVAAGPAGCTSVGADCPDGTVFAGLTPDGMGRLFTTVNDAAGTRSWNDGSANHAQILPARCVAAGTAPGYGAACHTGQYNSAFIAGFTGTGAPYAAARYCEELVENGFDDWYLPSQAELDILYDNRVAIGNFAAASYWSSSESTVNSDALLRNFSTGDRTAATKDTTANIRCVRKSSCITPAGHAGAIIYNQSHRVLQWCDGERWHAAGPVDPAEPATGCLMPAGTAGNVLYNSSNGAVQYCDGGIWRKVALGNQSCPDDATPGERCPDGSYYMGISPDEGGRLFMTAIEYERYSPFGADEGGTNLCTGQPIGNAPCWTGRANSASLALLPSQIMPVYCENLTAHGKSDWYVPARNEMSVLIQTKLNIGGGIIDLNDGWYATSSESSSNHVWLVNGTNSTQFHEDGMKGNSDYLRCVRRE